MEALVPTLTPDTPLVYNYTYVPTPYINNRVIGLVSLVPRNTRLRRLWCASQSRGRLLGGSTSVNFMVCCD